VPVPFFNGLSPLLNGRHQVGHLDCRAGRVGPLVAGLGAGTVNRLSGRFAAILCLGCVIRGQTPHFEYVAAEVAKGIAQVSLQTGVPVTFGIVTADSLEQAIDRAGAKTGNKGADAARAAIEMANLMAAIQKR
jgi:hypothetical protein